MKTPMKPGAPILRKSGSPAAAEGGRQHAGARLPVVLQTLRSRGFWTSASGRLLLIIAAAPILCAASCQPPRPTPLPVQTFATQEEAGVVNIGVQSVAAFEDYVDELQPKFTLSPEDALKKAVPTTELQEIREAVQVALKLALNLSQGEVLTESVRRSSSSRDSDGSEEVSSSREDEIKRSERSGAVPSVEIPDLPAELLEKLSGLTAVTDLDPSLQYRAATALLQDLALLSSYVREAAVKRDTLPFVVRLLVTVLPSADRTPYDIYSTISFYTDGFRIQPFNTEPASSRTDPIRDFGIRAGAGLSEIAHPGLVDLASLCESGALDVIPLFVTDNVEATFLRSARSAGRELSGALGGSVGSAGLGVGAGIASESEAKIASREVRGTFTLGRLSSNVLSIRIGAPRAEGLHQLAPRTYNVTALVLVPAPVGATLASLSGEALPAGFEYLEEEQFLLCEGGRFIAKTEFRDARTGLVLPSKSRSDLVERFESLLSSAAFESNAERALDAAIRGDFEEFRKVAREGDATIHWPEALTISSRSGFSGGSFQVPIRVFRFFDEARGDASLLDDGKKAWFQISGAVGLTGAGLSGRISTVRGDRTIWLESTSAVATEGGRAARVEFPSIRSLVGKDVESVRLELHYRPPSYRWRSGSTPPWWTTVVERVAVLQTGAPEPKAAEFSIHLSNTVVAADCNGAGNVSITVRALPRKKHDVRFSLSGGRILELPRGARWDGADLVMPSDGSYDLSIGSMVEGVPLTLSSWRMDGDLKIPGADLSLVPLSSRCRQPRSSQEPRIP